MPKQSNLKNNKTKDGWKLLENKPFKGKVKSLELVSFLKNGESFINGEEMKRRAEEIKLDYGQELAEYLLEHQDLIPKEAREYYLIFPGTVWRDSYGDRYVPYLDWYDAQWCLSFYWLGSDWNSHDRLVRIREVVLDTQTLGNLEKIEVLPDKLVINNITYVRE